jgi:hypothetical protein
MIARCSSKILSFVGAAYRVPMYRIKKRREAHKEQKYQPLYVVEDSPRGTVFYTPATSLGRHGPSGEQAAHQSQVRKHIATFHIADENTMSSARVLSGLLTGTASDRGSYPGHDKLVKRVNLIDMPNLDNLVEEDEREEETDSETVTGSEQGDVYNVQEATVERNAREAYAKWLRSDAAANQDRPNSIPPDHPLHRQSQGRGDQAVLQAEAPADVHHVRLHPLPAGVQVHQVTPSVYQAQWSEPKN